MTVTEPRAVPTTRDRAAVLALGAWFVLIVVASLWGEHFGAGRIGLGVPPLHSSWRPRPGLDTLLAVGTGAGALLIAPRIVDRLRWRFVPPFAGALAGLWAVVLAANDGTKGLTRGAVTSDYREVARGIDAPLVFLDRFSASVRAHELPVHTSGHPPGFVVVLWVLDHLGLRADVWPTALCIGGGTLAIACIAITVREVAGEPVGRAAVPFLALSPAAIWIATTPDAFFAGVGAAAVCATVLATSNRRTMAPAIAGGIAFAAAALLSYGLVLLAVIPVVVAVARRTVRPLVVAGSTAAAALCVVAFTTGFWWYDGLQATRDQYWLGIASARPFRYFVVANLAALAITCGPAAAVGLAWLRDRALWLLVGGAVAAVLVADLSAMSKGEVERIWLPFALWILPAAATATCARAPRTARALLALQVGTALVVQTFLHSA
ncbi:MAG TPA: hypothetical protein VFX21_03680 [Acidimicrobiia bacterium]|nr:hypothetical protein [Acidimicrobiia bacterium]